MKFILFKCYNLLSRRNNLLNLSEYQQQVFSFNKKYLRSRQVYIYARMYVYSILLF